MGNYNKYYDEDYYDDYGSNGRKGSKKPYKPKKKYKGHQNKFDKPSSRSFWEDDESLNNIVPTPYVAHNPTQTSKPIIQPRPQTEAPIEQQQKTFVPGEHSQEIKGNIIDFDRLNDIQKIEQEHNGAITYGIKFLFKGKKGLFRIVWYNRNQRLRDEVFNEKVAYWQEVQGY